MDSHVKVVKTSPPVRAENASLAEAPDNVNKIREIIFGTQMREYERRFEDLSNRYLADISRLKSDIDVRFERLEALLRKEVEETGKKIQTEKRDRNEAEENLGRMLQEAKKALSERVSSVDEHLSQQASALRNELHQEANAQTQRLNESIALVMQRIDGDVGALRGDKVARQDLGELLTELGMRLKGEFELP